MKKKPNAKKEITRDKKLEIRMSQEEKELWMKYAEDMGINASRLARNVLMSEAKSLINKYPLKQFVKAYLKYLELTDKEALKKIQEED